MTSFGGNLIPARRRLARRRRRAVARWAVALAVQAAAVVAVVGYVRVTAGGPQTALAAQADQLRGERDAMQRRVSALQAEAARLNDRLAAYRAVARQPDWAVLLRTLAETMGGRVVLSEVQLRADATGTNAAGEVEQRLVLELAGLAESQQAVAAWVLELEGLGIFERVHLADTSVRRSLDRDLIGFEIRCPFVTAAADAAPEAGADTEGGT